MSNKTVTILIKELKSLKDKSIGLLGKEEAEPVFFKTRLGIHTICVRFPIDVIILDENYTVKKIEEYLYPNRLFFWNPKYYNVLELPAGMIKKEKIKIGDIIRIRTI